MLTNNNDKSNVSTNTGAMFLIYSKNANYDSICSNIAITIHIPHS